MTRARKGKAPAKAEKEEGFDMPGADVETVRSAFFRQIRSA